MWLHRERAWSGVLASPWSPSFQAWLCRLPAADFRMTVHSLGFIFFICKKGVELNGPK